jgi:hypothetical protein
VIILRIVTWISFPSSSAEAAGPCPDDAIEIGGYLFALPDNVDGRVATSGFCAECWQTLPMSEVERISTRILHKIAPKGHFIDPGTSPCG